MIREPETEVVTSRSTRLVHGLSTCLLVILIVLLGSAEQSWASSVELYGRSVADAGRAGAGSLLEDGASAVAGNPGALGLAPHDSFRFGYLGGVISLDEVEGVVPTGDQDLRLPEQALAPHRVAAGLVKTLGPWVRAGVVVDVPIPYIYWHDTKDPWKPYAVRWQNRFARTVAWAGPSVRLPVRGIPGRKGVTEEQAMRGGLWLGASVSAHPIGRIGIDLALEGRTVDTGTDVSVILRDVALSARARFRPHLGLTFDLGTLVGALSGLRLGVSWANEMRVDIAPIELQIDVAGLGELSSLFSVVEHIQALVWLGLVDFYDPHRVILGLAWDRPQFAIALDVTWSGWSQLVPSYGRVLDPEEAGAETFEIVSTVEGLAGTYPVVGGRTISEEHFRDTWDLALGFEGRLPERALPGASRPLALVLRAGYRYRPAMLRPSSGPSALLDGDIHSAAFGVGLSGPNLPLLEGPLRLDGSVQVARIEGMTLPKTQEGLAGLDGLPVAYSEGASWSGGWSIVGGGEVSFGF